MSPPRPALLPALGLISGIGLAGADPRTISILAGLLIAACLRQRLEARVLAITLLACVLGVELEQRDRAHAERLRASVVGGASSGVRETHLVGELLTSVEPARGGERRLRLALETGGRRSERPVVEVQVRSSPADALLRVDALRPGDTLRVFARLRLDEDERGLRRLRIRGLHATGSVGSARAVERLRPGRRSTRRAIAELRERSRRRLLDDRDAADDPEALVAALVLADRRLIGPAALDAIREAGWLHLVAISGLHVGLIALAGRQTIGRRLRRPWIRAAAGAIGLAAFTSFVGAGVSVVRAGFALSVVLIGRASGRGGEPLNTLAWIAAAVAVAHPGWVDSAGYQLTCIATWGLLTSGRRIAALLPRGLPWRQAIGLSLGAYLAGAPISAAAFGLLAPFGALTHLVGLPLVGTALACGWIDLLAAGLGTIDPGAGQAARAAAGLSIRCAETFGRWSAAIAVAPPAPALMAVAIGSLGIGCGARGSSRRLAAWVAGASCVAIHIGPSPVSVPDTRVVVLDVGQGSATWIRSRAGGELLVDAGGSFRSDWDPGERLVVPRLRAAGVGRLDALFVSHGDADHAGGAGAVLRRIETAALLLPRGWSSHPRLRALAETARGHGVALDTARPGRSEQLAGLRVRVLSGGTAPARRTTSNDRSLVLGIDDGQAAVMIPGDISCEVEQRILSESPGVTLDARLLIVAHHGSRNGSCAAFVDAVGPAHAAISCGRGNRFGHPHRELLVRLRRRRVAIGVTARDGELGYESEGKGWRSLDDRDRERNEAQHEDHRE